MLLSFRLPVTHTMRRPCVLRPLRFCVPSLPARTQARLVFDDPCYRRQNEEDWTNGSKQTVHANEWRDAAGAPLNKQEAKMRQKTAVLATVPASDTAVVHDVQQALKHCLHVLYTNGEKFLDSDGGYHKPMLNADKLFKFCVKVEIAFLVTNLCLQTPLLFEVLMNAHLQYASLALAWWAAVYVGLDLAKYPGWVVCGTTTALQLPTARWYPRSATASLVFALGAIGLCCTEASVQLSCGPWISYGVLLSGYGVMLLLDCAFHKSLMLPSWLIRCIILGIMFAPDRDFGSYLPKASDVDWVWFVMMEPNLALYMHAPASYRFTFIKYGKLILCKYFFSSGALQNCIVASDRISPLSNTNSVFWDCPWFAH
ncbi:unnamed protein product [Amoebophrya sp. A120]|nr:unnamed protein product [Amoebophrya sp. A120]|eukprot:GSA120T00025376001.1